MSDRINEPLLAAPHDHFNIGEGGRHAGSEKGRPARSRTSSIPGCSGAANRTVNDVGYVANRQQRVAGAIEAAATLSGARFGTFTTGRSLAAVPTSRLIAQCRNVFW